MRKRSGESEKRRMKLSLSPQKVRWRIHTPRTANAGADLAALGTPAGRRKAAVQFLISSNRDVASVARTNEKPNRSSTFLIVQFFQRPNRRSPIANRKFFTSAPYPH